MANLPPNILQNAGGGPMGSLAFGADSGAPDPTMPSLGAPAQPGPPQYPGNGGLLGGKNAPQLGGGAPPAAPMGGGGMPGGAGGGGMPGAHMLGGKNGPGAMGGGGIAALLHQLFSGGDPAMKTPLMPGQHGPGSEPTPLSPNGVGGGNPNAQGWQGAQRSSFQNPNQGGYNGPAGADITNPTAGIARVQMPNQLPTAPTNPTQMQNGPSSQQQLGGVRQGGFGPGGPPTAPQPMPGSSGPAQAPKAAL